MQPISNAMRRFDVCANNYQLFAHFRAATILLSTIMQKYLLLLVCFIVSMNVHAGITVVPPEESENGSYVLTFNNETANGTSIYDWNSLPDYVKNATAITIVTADRYKLSETDVKNIMGVNTVFTQLTSLDMGDAVLASNSDLANMQVTKNNKGLTQLTYFVFPKTTTEIPAGMFSENTTIQEIIMLEPDHPDDPHLTAITEQAFQGCTSLVNVRIPDGITTIGANAFEHCPFEAISLPNTLTTIAQNAFGSCENLKSITIPASVTYIGPSAFQKNYSMTDVYIIGNDVHIGDQAFDHNLTQNEFNYHANGDGDVNTVTIKDWEYNNQIPLRLHIPNNQTALEHYMNPNLRFLNAMNDPRMVKQALEELGDSNASNDEYVQQTIDNIALYFSERWFDNTSAHPEATLCKNVLDKLKEICNANQIYSNDDVMANNWETMEGWRYFHTAGGKFNFGPGQSTSPYAGWWNFMFVAGDLEQKTWPDNRLIESRWYSAVFPFDMSYNQVMTTYGNGTDVREFTFVKQYKVNGKDKRTVCFNTPASIPAVSTMARSVDKNKAGYIVKGRPYMIHPGVRSEPIEVNGKTVYRTIAGVDVNAANAIVEANSDLETVYRNLVDADNNNAAIKENAYYFKGSYLQQDMPADCFYLGMWPDRPKTLAFYVNTSVGPGKWSAFTSVVQKSPNNTTESKTMDLDFKVILPFEEEMGIATRIDAVSMPNGKSDGMVYNLNGQVVRENNSLNGLNKGIYVVNGKKIVVR